MSGGVAYWQDPPDSGNRPAAYLSPENWPRTIQLCEVLQALIPPDTHPSILELGCNCGRNLAMLHFAGYTDLTGIELNPDAVALMREVFPFAASFDVQVGDVYSILPTIGRYDIVYTMAVLEHLPDDRIFPMIEGAVGKYLVTVEDERSEGARHFARRYDKVFSLKQVKKARVLGMNDRFMLRVFRRGDR